MNWARPGERKIYLEETNTHIYIYPFIFFSVFAQRWRQVSPGPRIIFTMPLFFLFPYILLCRERERWSSPLYGAPGSRPIKCDKFSRPRLSFLFSILFFFFKKRGIDTVESYDPLFFFFFSGAPARTSALDWPRLTLWKKKIKKFLRITFGHFHHIYISGSI